MEDHKFYKILAEQFLHSFEDDPVLVSESLENSGVEDVSVFYARVVALTESV